MFSRSSEHSSMRSVTILSNLFLLKKTMMVHSLSYVHMLDHPWCILDQWSNNHHTVVQYLGRWQILDRLWHFIVFQFYQKNPGYGLFWRDMRIPWMNTFGLEWISSACLNLPRWNGSRCLGGPISIALPYRQRQYVRVWVSGAVHKYCYHTCTNVAVISVIIACK